MHYVDTCALLKLVKAESETAALRSWVKGLSADEALVTSELAELELTRSLTRHGVESGIIADLVNEVLDMVDVAVLSKVVLCTAIGYRIQRLGSLDAIHLATAELFRSELGNVVTYDKELAAAAEVQGLKVIAPT
ncbi:type II toxin-antitoxin system VapC family toxin [Glycomyces xiaoerkulensis]|uniref:type II toxin-antitoxin system VapC family toxin n=1 Tax=Glycomyces xiaoerkulensis TaxID=2038139 RepID=UPI000C25C852|nr:type II toxin-antitoxin system VapC family toxin [Glycomyces xiaoerkulensis]